jgi:glycosyltransferase involved in cell wall biosynthesis
VDKKSKIIGFPHPPQKHGGPGSFQIRLENALKEIGWRVVYPEDAILPDVILVVGGTKKHGWLKKCKKQGTRIVHRLDGRNWLHRVKKMPLKQKFLCEIRNRMTARIRKKYADHVIYQSQFVKDWWERVSGETQSDSSIIYNAVDLEVFMPSSCEEPLNLICVEGTIDYSPFALETLSYLARELKGTIIDKVLVYGSLEVKSLKEKYSELNFEGVVPREKINEVYRNGIYLSLDVNAACPNTVIEALACGIPVVGFDTGALKELVHDGAGEIVEYGSDPWKLETPKNENLAEAVLKVSKKYSSYSNNARKLAEEQYSLDTLTEKYINILEK